jgi:hypothetical protein
MGEILGVKEGPLLPCSNDTVLALRRARGLDTRGTPETLWCDQQVTFHILVHDVLKGEAEKKIPVSGRLPALFASVCDQELKLVDGLRVAALLLRKDGGYELLEGFSGLWYLRPEDEERYRKQEGLLGRTGCPPPKSPSTGVPQPEVGDLVKPGATNLSCHLWSLEESYRVGDEPHLKVIIANRSPQTVYLVPALDDSDSKARFPVAYFTVSGPANGFAPVIFGGCGFMNPIRYSDFAAVGPGAGFDPYTTLSSGWPREVPPLIGTFKRSGRYTITFHYSSNEPRMERWVFRAGDDPESKAISDLLRQIPRLDLSCSITLDVEGQQ